MLVNEQILIKEIKQGRSNAQKTLYDTYAKRLMVISIRYVGRKDIAEDILHDSFIKIFKNIGKFNYRGEGSLRAWMDRITVNTALEWLRVQKKTTLLDENYIPDVVDDEPSYSEVKTIPQEIILKLVGELPIGYRTIFNLFCIEGYSHREIAEELGIKEKSSSSQLLRAKRLLANKIKSHLESYE
ncbi:MAG: RNA polymerase sigma factor [Rikenellaceae bacterium]